MKLALAQIGPALGDVERNLALHEDSARAARREGADLVVFPERGLSADGRCSSVATWKDLARETLRRARSTYPLLRDERLDLVLRELQRIRRRRVGWPVAEEEEECS